MSVSWSHEWRNFEVKREKIPPPLFRIFIIFLFVCCTYSLSAQTKTDTDYQTYRKTFQKEIGQFGHKSKTRHVFYVQLPGWFSNNPGRGLNKILAIGISNPGMDSSRAVKQATMRACGLEMLYRYCIVHCMTRLFNENYPTLDKNFMRFISVNSIDADTSFHKGSFRIIKKTTLPSKETLVEVAFGKEINSTDPALKLRLHLDFYTQDETGNDKETFQSKISWHLCNRVVKDTINDNFDLYCLQSSYLWNGDFEKVWNTSDSLKYSFYYWANDNVQEKSQSGQTYSLRQGLWSAYLNAIVNDFFFSTYSNRCKTNIKSLSDFYTLKTISFSQTINSDTTSDYAPDIFLKDNHLVVKSLNQ